MQKERYQEICDKHGFEEISEYEDNICIKVDQEKHPEKEKHKEIIKKFLKEGILYYYSKYNKEIKVDKSDSVEILKNLKIHKMHKVRYDLYQCFVSLL